MKSRVPCKQNRDTAQSAVEFALVLPILLLIMLGMIETGRLIFHYSTVTNAAREAMRYGSATGLNENGIPRFLDCDGIINSAVQIGFLGNIQPEHINVTFDSGPDTAPLGGCPTNTNGITTPPANTDIRTGIRVVVEVNSPFDTIIPGMLPYQDMNLASESSRTIIRSINVAESNPSDEGDEGNEKKAEPTPTATPTFTPTKTHTNTPTATNTPTFTFTPSNTPTVTLTPALSYTPSQTFTPTNTPINTPTPTNTPTAPPTFTNTPQCSISADNLTQNMDQERSNFALTFTLNQPPASYYISTLSISTTQTVKISKIIMNGFEYTTNNFSYKTNKTLNLFDRYISLQNGTNSLYIEYDKNIGQTGHTNAVNLTVWTPAGLTPSCEQVSWQLQP